MFQLFKKRSFSSYINDTFDFFKVEGKNYMKNYFLINGGFLVLMLISFYFVFQVYFDIIQSGSIGYEPDFIINYLQDNALLVFCFGIIMVATLLIFSAISYSYPSLYLKNMEKFPGATITSEMIIADLKKQIGRILIYILGLVFIVMPLFTVAFGLTFMMIFIIIGIPLLLLLLPTLLSLSMLSYNDYLVKGTPFFQSFATAFKMLKNNFWPIIGSTLIMYIILQVVLSIFTLIPQIMMMLQMFTSLKSDSDIMQSSSFSLLYLITFIISIVVSFVLNNLLMINQGLIYYSEREVMENNQSRFDIDQLGQSNE
ncbi:hypothetical protein [Flavobacterium sp. JP2137]|uniref:hypothetical protein n=1 Tax=Flavobacterium sp. JP2137 TaxID=3414510 RepID=UPI003D2FF263